MGRFSGWQGTRMRGVLLCAVMLSVAAQAQDAAQTPFQRVLREDPPLSELLERQPALQGYLEGRPDLWQQAAPPPSWWAKFQETLTNPWVIFGFLAQGCFMMRFVVQWISSERKQRSHVPVAFWYFSLAGGMMLLTYAIHRRDPVFILGQSLGLLIYSRNLVLIYRRSEAHRSLLAGRERNAPAPAAAAMAAIPLPPSVSEAKPARVF